MAFESGGAIQASRFIYADKHYLSDAFIVLRLNLLRERCAVRLGFTLGSLKRKFVGIYKIVSVRYTSTYAF